MFKHYLITASRFLKHNKIFAAINASGLSIALAASFIILLFVINQFSYDDCHRNRKRVFRILNYYVNFNKTIAGAPYILAQTLKDEYPQVEKAISVSKMGDFKLKVKDELINVSETIATDPDVFNIFTLPMIDGSSGQNLLDDPNSLLLSRELAQKIFAGKNPEGKEITGIVNNEERVFVIKGVFENIPKNSTFRAQCLLNSRWAVEAANKIYKIATADKDWDLDFWTTYVLLSKDCNVGSLEQQFRNLEIKYVKKNPDKHYSLQNLSDVYLRSDNVMYSQIRGDTKIIRMLLVIAFLILLVASINYIILSTAVSTGRAKEIGIRKTIGIMDRHIRNQLLIESMLLVLLSLPVVLIIMSLVLPFAGKFFQTDLYLISSNFLIYISVYLALTLFIGLTSGIYTSYYLSRLKVLDILKNSTHFGRSKQFVRSSLIVIQLVIFCSFAASTIIIRSQYRMALKTNPGYNTHNILFIDLGNDFKGYPALINSIKPNANVVMVSAAMDCVPNESPGYILARNFQNKEIKVSVERLLVDYNFLNTIGVGLLQGRDFSEEYGSDMTKAGIINETAVKELGITDPIGKTIGSTTIIGIVKDFNVQSIRTGVPPVIICMTDRYIHQVIVHYKPETLNKLLPFLEAEWKKIAPDRPFRYSTIEENIRAIYSTEKNLSTIVSIFALFTLLIAAFGLFGLTLFVSKTRTKEIGIKKIFGSSERSIIYSFLSGNFILVLSASLLSIPVTLYIMKKWLNNFSFKIHISWWVFAAPFVVATIVVLSTVFIHSYKAARINPVNALKYE
jgi:putative ABC transport system permease protein